MAKTIVASSNEQMLAELAAKDFAAELAAEAAEAPRKESRDTFAELHEACAEYDRLEQEKKDLEKKIEANSKAMLELKMKKLVDLFLEMPGLGDTTVNGKTFKLGMYFNARIPKPPEEKQFVFEWLESVNLQSIVASVITMELAADDYEGAELVCAVLKHFYPDAPIEWEKTVPWKRYESTMRAEYVDWLNRPSIDPQTGVEKEPMPLKELGITVGQMVEVKVPRN
jgi:hypothetical protein